MNSKEVAKISGVSVRTLHHYDELGLLIPRRHPDNGYRQYSQADLDKLQQILFFRECGFALEKIKSIVADPTFDPLEAFLLQKKALLYEKARIEQMLVTLEKSIQEVRGERKMQKKEKFEGFDFSKNPYEEEARERWGDEAVDRSQSHLNKMDKNQQQKLGEDMNGLFQELADISHLDPASEEVQTEMQKMFEFFNSSFGYAYSYEAFAGLGRMYIDDERFKENIDKFRPGLSEFLAEAMKSFAEKNAGL